MREPVMHWLRLVPDLRQQELATGLAQPEQHFPRWPRLAMELVQRRQQVQPRELLEQQALRRPALAADPQDTELRV